MKSTLLTLFILIAIGSSGQAQLSFQEKIAITDLVSRWNSAMHMSTIDRLNNLYAPEVLINGEHKTREDCIKEKSDLVNQFAGLHQEIITPIDITFYQSGTIRCSFIKRVNYKDTSTDYQSYLLLKKEGDHYQITGEGGQESEQSLKAGVKLGGETSPPSSGDSSWIIFCGASIFLMFIVVWVRGKSRMAAHSFMHPRTDSNATSDENISQTAAPDDQDKGPAFEEFILHKFPKDTFNLVEWKREKIQDDGLLRDPDSYRDGGQRPDLQLELKGQSEKYPFAVECKWRNDFWKGIIEWARDAQISSYQEFQTSKEMPVFIALGVGGTPSDPRDLFIIPLSHLYQSILTQDWLKKYRRDSRGDFSLSLDPILLK
jgi:hypothetical protein